MKKKKKETQEEYKGIVVQNFETTEKSFKVGDTYKTENKNGFDYLEKINKVRKA